MLFLLFRQWLCSWLRCYGGPARSVRFDVPIIRPRTGGATLMASYNLINNLLADIPLVYADADGRVTSDIPADMSVASSDPSVIPVLSSDFKTVTIAAGLLVGGATITVGSASVPSLGATLDVVVSMPAPGPAATVSFDLAGVVTRPNPTPPTA